MKVLAYGDILNQGNSVFAAVAYADGDMLLLALRGVIRIENPYLYLQPFIDELSAKLAEISIAKVELDFTKLRFCNSNGFYVIMDIVEAIYRLSSGPVTIRRLDDDDWHQETLPILVDIASEEVSARTRFESQLEA
ncbi:MAG: hypothetical protein RBU37_07470 [Myxococcota bacterium]|jgi:hypothetical protein|nr:hypothetical protein [Myxococcota bacterium]